MRRAMAAHHNLLPPLPPPSPPPPPPGPENHLYFYSTDGIGRCGEVDAAPFMPATLFEPANLLALAAYAEAAIRLYTNPMRGATALKLGQCASIGYTHCGGRVQGIGWTPSALMGPVCAEQCECNYEGASTIPGLPYCKDQPDDPEAGKWCSLCGPTTSCADCVAGSVTISLYDKPSPGLITVH